MVIDVFRENLELVYEKKITYKHDIDKNNLENLIKMTPLTPGLTKEQIDKLLDTGITEITIDLKVLVGKKKAK